MQFIADGPDIPAEVLNALEKNRLILFCGAGISVPSGLPGFKSLVEKVVKEVGGDFKPLEAREFKAENYDRVLGLLEQRIDSNIVRKKVRYFTPPTRRYLTNTSSDTQIGKRTKSNAITRV